MNDSVNRLPETNYSYHWGMDVVQRFMKSSSRVHYFYCEILGLSERQMATIIAKRPDDWQNLKAGYRLYKVYMEKQLNLFPEAGENDHGAAMAALERMIRRKTSVKLTEKMEKWLDSRYKLTNTQRAG